MKASRLTRWAPLLTFPLILPSPVSARQAEKYTAWFPLVSDDTFGSVSTGICNSTLDEYRISYRHNTSAAQATSCVAHQKCILENLRADITARMASASVLLGLTPVLLASLGPTVAEISLLSTQRPLLSLLLSFGSPAVYQSRVLKYDNSLDILRDKTRAPSFLALQQSKRLQVLVSALQYLLVLTAIGNILYTSYELGVRTSITFQCSNAVLPLVWTLLPVAVHLPSALALNWGNNTKMRKVDSSKPDPKAKSNPKSKPPSLLQRETELCLVRQPSINQSAEPSAAAVLLNYLGTFLGFLHVTFGILIFSSIIFIELIDVLTVIVRYLVSTAVCRMVLSFELAGIRVSNPMKKEKEAPAAQTIIGVMGK